MNLFQLLTIPITAALLIRSIYFLFSRRQSIYIHLLGAFIWLAATVAILRPELTIRVAGFLGIGRGADLVLYFLVIAYLISIFYIYQRFQKMESKISELVRYITLQNVHEPQTRDKKIQQENLDIQ